MPETMKHDSFAFDRASVRVTDVDGRLRLELTNISKAAVNPYLGREIPDYEALGLDADRIYQVLRDPAELEKSAPTFNNLPLLSNHVPVTADDHRPDLVVGSTGTDAAYEPPYLKNSLIVWSAAAIAGIESGQQKELSSAYRYRAVKESGTFEGQPYDLRMADIVGNHVALVETGRAGPDVVVADANPFTKEPEMKKKQRLIAAKADARKALSGVIAQDADLSLLDKLLARLAMDAETDEEAEKKVAEDESDEDEEGDDDATKAEKAKRRAAKAKPAEDADDAPGNNAKDTPAKPEVTKGAMDAAIAAAVSAATVKVKAEMEALHAARKEVSPIVGEVALDSAEAVYKFALDQAGVDVEGVHPSAYRAMVKMHQAEKAKPAAIGMDAAAAKKTAEQFPNLSRFGAK